MKSYAFARIIRRVFPLLRFWLVGSCIGCRALAAEITNTHRAVRAVADVPYLQESGRTVLSTNPLLSVAVHRGDVWVGTSRGARRLAGSAWLEDAALREPVRRLVAGEGELWALTSAGLYRRVASDWRKVSDLAVADITPFRGDWIASADNRLFRIRNDRVDAWSTNAARFAVARVVAHNDT
ncbi:MAG: hypothetical protein JNL97_05735, partial [Verrucomicrobiales bacterium]|nr:hypothetical protein [Verrucomicrobiales bacterium]